MGVTLEYHRTVNDIVLSLKFLNTDRERVDAVREDLETGIDTGVEVITRIEEYAFDEKVYAVYGAESHPRQLPPDWESGLEDDDLVLADAVIRSFQGVSERWEERGTPLNWYKKPRLKSIVDAFDRVTWRQSVPNVAGEIMSELLCKHPLPNANQRTAVAVVRTYLQSMAENPDVAFPSAGNYRGDWHNWAREYVHESKRLLLLRRKSGLLEYARQYGVTTVERKSGISIDLTAHSLGHGNAETVAKDAHQNRCVHFVTTLLERSDHDYLRRKQDDGRNAFVDRLR